ncbi:MAG: acyl--CoA ligase, partial [Deltaproteobacteria bacterium]|nr:acyl--CoA ligase [Deltaproteobacteria bacterium]
MKRITASKLEEYQSQGYWKGLTLEKCREFEDRGYWRGITIQEYLAKAAEEFPDNEAFVYNDQRITFQQYNRAVNNLAGSLIKLGIKKGDIVCVQLHNCPEMAYLQVALPKIGAIIQPIHVVYRSLEIRKRLEFCEAKAYIIPMNVGEFDFSEMAMEMKKDFPELKILAVPNGGIVPDNMISLSTLCEKEENLPVLENYLKDEYEADPNDILFLNFTSGTETDPKGFLHTHNGMLGMNYIACNEVCKFRKGDESLLSFAPMTHGFGSIITNFGIMSCGKIIIVQTFSPTQTLPLIEKEKITFMQGTPTHLSRLMNHEDFKKYDLTSLRFYGTGGAPISPSLVRQFKEELPSCKLSDWFGMGEDLIHTLNWPDDPLEAFLETVGVPFPNDSEVMIFDENHNPLPQGEPGEIGYRGPNMFLGYYKNPDKTDSTRTEDGWFLTGDSGYIDEDGRLRLRGRKKDVINRGGSKMFPLSIENILCFHPKIASVAVVGLPDPDLGEIACACIIPKKGQPISHEDVALYMK